jgi:enoyl-CoA hydratase/carnithine racemase
LPNLDAAALPAQCSWCLKQATIGLGTHHQGRMGTILSSRDGALITLELLNPKKANAIDLAMLADLERLLGALEQDSSARVLVIRGARDGTFSAGADIRDWSALSPAQFGSDWLQRGNLLFNRLEQLPLLTVSVIEGMCLGGGLELALCTDLRIASDKASFSFPEVGIGAFPGWLGGCRLGDLIGRGRAMEMVLLAQRIDAPTALQYGLVNQVHEAAAIDHAIALLVQKAFQLSGPAQATAKGAFFAADRLAYHARSGSALRASADAQEGLQAFFEKRSPNFGNLA